MPRTVSDVSTVALKDNVINALSEGQNINQYCMYARPVQTTAASAADTWDWDSSGYWAFPEDKPYLVVMYDKGVYDN